MRNACILPKSEFTIALTGNPNSGKTTIFNGLTGDNQKIGNWAGVTVDLKEGQLRGNGKKVRIVDLPGIYSMSSQSDDERVSRDFLLSGEVDLIVNIVDASNIERNLYLTTQLLEMNIPVLVILNRVDLAKKGNIEIDVEHFSNHLSVPVYTLSAIHKSEVENLKSILLESSATQLPTVAIDYDDVIKLVVNRWSKKLSKLSRELSVNSKWIALKLLEGDRWITNKVVDGGYLNIGDIEQETKGIENILNGSIDIILADYRFGFINGLVRDVVFKKVDKHKLTDIIDKYVLHRFFGIPIFLTIMYFMFWFSIVVGGSFIDFFDISFGAVFVDAFGSFLTSIGSPTWLVAILAGGVGAGIQTVSTFIPIIFSMFVMLSILEDSGYMARAAYIMDRSMRVIGLPGKSFVPMILGFGCSVPAVMATRTLESRKDRVLTVFMIPFLSCGAKLPVYVLFVAVFFPKNSGFIVFSLYLLGIAMAIFTGIILKKTIYKGDASHFVMELPIYNTPRINHIIFHTWHRLKDFIFNAGKIIVIVVTVLSFINSVGTDGSFGNENNEKSVLSKIGKSITPVFHPMGITQDNWPASVALFSGIFAKEAIVGTLNSLYGRNNTANQPKDSGTAFLSSMKKAFYSIPRNLSGIFGGLGDSLGAGVVSKTSDKKIIGEELEVETSVFSSMKRKFGSGVKSAYAYLLFILLYFPCVATFGTITREVGRKVAFVQMVYLTVLAWVVATLYYQFAVAHNPFWILLSLGIISSIILGLYLYGKKYPMKSDMDECG